MKPDDIPFLIRNLEGEMPIHNEHAAKIPYGYKPFPKNLMEESHKVDNKFLNHHLAEIEEANHCKILSPRILQYFLHQQRKYHFESGILNHDGFLKKPIEYHNLSLLDVGFVGSLSVAGVNGPDLEVGTTETSTTGWNGDIRCWNVTGNATDLYDQIAVNNNVAAGNNRLGVYDDTGGTLPDNLQATTGSIANTSGFTFASLTEFALATNETWIATQFDTTSRNGFYQVSGGNAEQKTFTYGAFQDPITGTTNFTVTIGNSKIGHS